MKYEIEIEDGLIPEGREPLRLGVAVEGDEFFEHQDIYVAGRTSGSDVRLILKPLWQPPSWMGECWLFKDKGILNVSNRRPDWQLGSCYWRSRDICIPKLVSHDMDSISAIVKEPIIDPFGDDYGGSHCLIHVNPDGSHERIGDSQ